MCRNSASNGSAVYEIAFMFGFSWQESNVDGRIVSHNVNFSTIYRQTWKLKTKLHGDMDTTIIGKFSDSKTIFGLLIGSIDKDRVVNHNI